MNKPISEMDIRELIIERMRLENEPIDLDSESARALRASIEEIMKPLFDDFTRKITEIIDEEHEAFMREFREKLKRD